MDDAAGSFCLSSDPVVRVGTSGHTSAKTCLEGQPLYKLWVGSKVLAVPLPEPLMLSYRLAGRIRQGVHRFTTDFYPVSPTLCTDTYLLAAGCGQLTSVLWIRQ